MKSSNVTYNLFLLQVAVNESDFGDLESGASDDDSSTLVGLSSDADGLSEVRKSACLAIS